MELKGKYTGSSKSNASSQSLGSNPTNYKISRTRRRTESANFIRLQLEYLHL
jgi:vacuolar fusion protein MON1